MAKILFSPSKYVQGAGELARLASHIESLGKTALIIITESGFKRVGEKIEVVSKKAIAVWRFAILMESVLK